MVKQALIGGLGSTELIIILVLVLIFFGAGKLPSVVGSIGKSIRNFKKEMTGEDSSTSTSEKKTKSKIS